MNQTQQVHTIAVVIPVYLGETTLDKVVEEIASLTTTLTTSDGHQFRVDEIVLVNDCGPDSSDEVIRRLSERFAVVRPVFLSRNFGQHAATIAGIAATSSDWIVTLDEDGQHDPGSISTMLDRAIRSRSALVYARPTNETPHSYMRRVSSRIAKRLVSILSGTKTTLMYSSFRLVLGEIGRSIAAFAGPSVYLDVALSWITQDVESVNVAYRNEIRSVSGYSTRKLVGHFWRLVVTAGTRPLRFVSMTGAFTGAVGFMLAIKIVFDRIVYGISAVGWTSVIVGILIFGGAILLSIGIIAEYLGLVIKSSLGQPTYLTVRDPQSTPRFGRGTGTNDK